ncbi:hypothetical protein ACP70R_004371 [Stipagrostis hirtigluma subsp. patula]
MMEPTRQIKFLTYNVWSREDMVVRARMQALGLLVLRQKPDVIFFQEVTPHILRIFQSHHWWEWYTCSAVEEATAPGQHFCLLLSKLPIEGFCRWPLRNSSARRCYLEASVNPGGGMKPIHVATAHLESPDPPATMRCVERAVQAEHILSALNREDNVVFGGDMSWDDKVDLPFPLLEGWVDAWEKLRPSDRYYTFDDLWNREPLRASCRDRKFPRFIGPPLESAMTQRRSDRFVCKLKDYELKSIELIGVESKAKQGFRIYSGLSFLNDRDETIDFVPSSHFGVVLTLVPKEEEP